MLKPAAWALLLLSAASAKPVPYRDSFCQVRFPGNFASGQQAVSFVRPNLQLYLISWPTSSGQATAFLANLYQQARTRGCQVNFLTRNRASGLQILEVLTTNDRNLSQYYLVYGRCYEFRACIHDGRAHPEVDDFFGSIRFQARTINLRSAIQNYAARPALQAAPPPRPRPGPASPYTF